jgi:hypothetical protein
MKKYPTVKQMMKRGCRGKGGTTRSQNSGYGCIKETAVAGTIHEGDNNEATTALTEKTSGKTNARKR